MTGGGVVDVVGGQALQITSDHDGDVDLSLVIPTFNEAGNIVELVRRLHGILSDAGITHELIVVDDDSPDRTWEVAGALVEEVPTLLVLRRTGESGLATAVVCGWAHARSRVLGVIDGDGQHPPDVLLELLGSLDERTDVAVASRHLPGGGVSNWSAARRLLSRGAQALGLLLLPGTVGRVTDPMSGYFLVRREALTNHELHPVGYKILLEVLARCDIRRVAETPYVFLERERGESKVRPLHYLDYLRHLMRLRVLPLRSQALARYFAVTLSALIVDAAAFIWLFDGLDLNLTRSAALAGEVAILYTVLLLDLWTFAGRVARTAIDRIRRLLGVQLALGILLFGRLMLINALVNWFHLGPLAAFLVALAAVSPVGHLLGSRLTWRPTRG